MKKAAMRTLVRQMCSLGLSFGHLVPSLLASIREVVPADGCLFARFATDARLTHLYRDGNTPALDDAEGGIDPTWPAIRKVLRQEAAAEEPGTGASTARQVRLFDAKKYSILLGTVRYRFAVVGHIVLCRDGAFSGEEVTEFLNILRYAAVGLAAPSQATPVTAYHDAEESGFLVVDSSNAIHHASSGARLMLCLAAGATVACDSSRLDAGSQGLVSRVCDLARERHPPRRSSTRVSQDTIWGRYVLDAVALGVPGSDRTLIGVHIRRQEPAVLRFAKAMSKMRLSPQQREIALMIFDGRSNQEIANALGISTNTVAYHLKQLFTKLDVRDRTGVVVRIANEVDNLREQKAARPDSRGRPDPAVSKERLRERAAAPSFHAQLRPNTPRGDPC